MKRIPILLVLLLTVSLAFGQKKEKLKGTRMVTITQKEIGEFENVEAEDNLEVFLIKGDKCALEIEADDNVHEAIDATITNGTLRLSTTKDISAKKLSVKVTYTDDFKMMIAKDDTNVTALTDVSLDNFTFKTSGSSKVFANVRSKIFTLMANDKSKTELNVTAENTTIELNKNAQLKALISSPKLKFDMYLKSTATIEGDVNDLKLRLDSNTNFTGRNLTANTSQIIIEGSANASVSVTTSVVIEASGKSELELYGDQKIEIKKFTENAMIRKRVTKN